MIASSNDSQLKVGSGSRLMVVAAAGLLVIAAGRAASADVIVQDGFSGTNGAAVNGRTPDTTDLPGGTYAAFSNFGEAVTVIDTSAGNPLPAAKTLASNVTSISIASAGTYVKPTTLAISADLQLNTLANGTGANLLRRGLGLGFFSASAVSHNDPDVSGSGANNGFTGVFFDLSGDLVLAQPGTADSIIHTYDSTALGALSTSAFYNLSYTVNTATGGILGVTLSDGSGSVTYIPTTTAFTNTATDRAAFESTSANFGQFGRVDNFTVTTPEPASLGLLGVAGLILARRAKCASR